MPLEQAPRQPIDGFLADTCWYGLTNRLNEKEFLSLVALRAQQGFQAIQLAVCIPSEIGPLHPNARSEASFPWLFEGPVEKRGPLKVKINHDYLDLARERIRMVNDHGLGAIVYGAWGNQIEWIGSESMKEWWEELISKLNDLNVIYCLTGESNILIGAERKLFPDKSFEDFESVKGRKRIPDPIWYLFSRYLRPYAFDKLVRRNKLNTRIEQWSEVLESVAKQTDKPLLLHPAAGYHSHNSVKNPQHLSAVTAYTGHFQAARASLWREPERLRKAYPGVPYINLESWYEGIKNTFGTADQIFSFWVSMLSGAVAHCYGAQGIWNVGRADDNFLNYWGSQTYDDAIRLKTPELMVKSYKELVSFLSGEKGERFSLKTKRNELAEIGMETASGKQIFYYPNTALMNEIQSGDAYWDPLLGEYIDINKSLLSNQLVVFRK